MDSAAQGTSASKIAQVDIALRLPLPAPRTPAETRTGKAADGGDPGTEEGISAQVADQATVSSLAGATNNAPMECLAMATLVLENKGSDVHKKVMEIVMQVRPSTTSIRDASKLAQTVLHATQCKLASAAALLALHSVVAKTDSSASMTIKPA